MVKGGFKKPKKIVKKKSKKSDKKVNLLVKIEKPRIKLRAVKTKEVVRKVKKVKNVKIDKDKTEKSSYNETIENLEQTEAIYEKIEKDKKIMLIAGVSFFMILIVSFWVYNTKKVFQQTAKSIENNTTSSFSEITDELGKNITEMKDGLTKIKEFESRSATTTATTTFQALPDGLKSTASTTEISTTTLSQKLELEILKQKIEDLENKIK